MITPTNGDGSVVTVVVLVFFQVLAMYLAVLAMFAAAGWMPRRSLLIELRGLMRGAPPEDLQVFQATRPVISVEDVCRQIVERSQQITRTLHGNLSDAEVEMCVMGYRACARDMALLLDLIEEELPLATRIRRLKLKILRRRAAGALFRVREAFPPGTLRYMFQEFP
jgi:hypothetical protein